jgi:hypothetical protein
MAGQISTLNVSMTVSANVQSAYVTNTLTGSTGLTGTLNVGGQQTWQNLSSLPTGQILANQCKYIQQTVVNGTPVTIDLSAASANLANDSTATFANIGGVIFWVPLPTSVPSLGISSQASSVTFGGAGTSPWIGPFGTSTSTITIPKGGIGSFYRLNSDYWSVGSTNKNLQIVNNDAVNSATVLIFLVGKDS